AANAFALMGLRQLYFLLGGLVKKLVYLSYGLAVILAFIAVKLVLHALYEYRVVPEWLRIPSWLSLVVIVAVVVLTRTGSVIRAWWSPRSVSGPGLGLDANEQSQRAGSQDPLGAGGET